MADCDSSIPHSTPSPGQNNGLSVSPTSSSNPLLKEGSHLNDEKEEKNDTQDEIEKDLQDETVANEVSPNKLATETESTMRTE